MAKVKMIDGTEIEVRQGLRQIYERSKNYSLVLLTLLEEEEVGPRGERELTEILVGVNNIATVTK